MSTIFVALQCCQSAAMKVKQQKMISQKWTCIICNQKQSVRKVFTRGFVAKDVRKFVQDFNMSRQIVDTLLSVSPECEETLLQKSIQHQKKRTDWTEYLDDQDNENKDSDSDGKLQIVTEPPREMSEKLMLERVTLLQIVASTTAGGSKLLKPNFPKRKGNQNLIQQESTDSNKCRGDKTQINASKWCDYLDEEEKEKLPASLHDFE